MASDKPDIQVDNVDQAAANHTRHLRRTEHMRQTALWLSRNDHDLRLQLIASTLDSPKSDIVKLIVECALDAIDDDMVQHFKRAGDSLLSIACEKDRRARMQGYFRHIQRSVQATAGNEAALNFVEWHEELDRKAIAARDLKKREAESRTREIEVDEPPKVDLDAIGAELGLL